MHDDLGHVDVRVIHSRRLGTDNERVHRTMVISLANSITFDVALSLSFEHFFKLQPR